MPTDSARQPAPADATALLAHVLRNPPELNGQLESRWPDSTIPYPVAVLIAQHAVFFHPDDVRQLNGQPLLRMKRKFANRRKQSPEYRDVYDDDNAGPHFVFEVFLNWQPRDHGYTVCHIWQDSTNPEAFTDPRNLCALPFWLTKFSDSRQYRAIFAWRSKHLYWPANTTRLPSWALKYERDAIVEDLWRKLQWREPTMAKEHIKDRALSLVRGREKSHVAQCITRGWWAFGHQSPGTRS